MLLFNYENDDFYKYLRIEKVGLLYGVIVFILI